MYTPEFRIPLDKVVQAFFKEARKRRTLLAIFFVLISSLCLYVGMNWPKVYSSSTTLVIDDTKIIEPLMKGTAVSTEVKNHAGLAKELIYGRSFLEMLVESAGWEPKELSPLELEQTIDSVRARIEVINVGKNIIKVGYSDQDPQRAYQTASILAELYISESLAEKARESQAAFEFIDNQVMEYHLKLMDAEEQLKLFRSQNMDARPGSGAEVTRKLNELQSMMEQTNLELKEARIKEKSLARQLSGEAELSSSMSREGRFRTRLAELQSQLDQLRLNYHETYPDIVQVKGQIEDLKRSIIEEKSNRENRKKAGRKGKPFVDENISLNPLYQSLRSDLSEAKTKIVTLVARLAELERLKILEEERGKRIHMGEATLAELTRDYEVNRDIYNDLMRKRENARVSMNLDRDQQGLSLKITEQAYLPAAPSGVRFMHFVIGGLLLGLIIPLGVLYLVMIFDPRIRHVATLSDQLSLKVIAIVPTLRTPREISAEKRSSFYMFMVLSVGFGIYAYVGYLKLKGIS